jgi:hypothetical protein
MSTKKRPRNDPRKVEDDKSEDLSGETTLPKGGGDRPRRSRAGDTDTAEASGRATISDTAQPSQGVAAGALGSRQLELPEVRGKVVPALQGQRAGPACEPARRTSIVAGCIQNRAIISWLSGRPCRGRFASEWKNTR